MSPRDIFGPYLSQHVCNVVVATSYLQIFTFAVFALGSHHEMKAPLQERHFACRHGKIERLTVDLLDRTLDPSPTYAHFSPYILTFSSSL